MINNSQINFKIILASKSPRRIEILNQLGLDFQTLPSSFDETTITETNPIEFVKKASLGKAKIISEKRNNSLVIGADTIVVLNNQIIGKPKSKDDAINILQKLSNNTHKVITGFSLLNQNKNIKIVDYDITKVTFRKLEKSEIEEYISEYKPFDKAGAYGIQDLKAMLVKKIDGDYFNVLGFPISKFYETLIQIYRDFSLL
ncbi:MAG: Maf family protein [Candidatus Marinimicrobia bacterium]|nr:Maf family protein [Candidatus Neomarinimicrobiota bacterium]